MIDSFRGGGLSPLNVIRPDRSAVFALAEELGRGFGVCGSDAVVSSVEACLVVDATALRSCVVDLSADPHPQNPTVSVAKNNHFAE